MKKKHQGLTLSNRLSPLGGRDFPAVLDYRDYGDGFLPPTKAVQGLSGSLGYLSFRVARVKAIYKSGFLCDSECSMRDCLFLPIPIRNS
jgi:hypothetical protein